MRIEMNRKLNERQKKIIRVSLVGIATNFLLAVIKILLGVFSGSIAIISDAFNNLTDSASSMITIIGTKLAGKRPTRDHPFGYGRIEYIISVLIGVILIFTGAQILLSSVKNIITPKPVNYTMTLNLIITSTILVKLLLSRYTKRAGERLESGALKASGADAGNDALISAVTLLSSAVYMTTGVSIDAWAGAFISLFILKTGIDVFIDMHGHFLGQRADRDLSEMIYNNVLSCPVVLGAHDLILHDYGPDRMNGSINLEVDASMTTGELYPILYDLQQHLLQDHFINIIFGICAVDPADPEQNRAEEILGQILEEEPHLQEYHGIFVHHDSRSLYCDVVIDFDCRDPYEVADRITGRLKKEFPDYLVYITVDNFFA